MANVIIYTRVSSKAQEDNFSLAAQLNMCRDFILRNIPRGVRFMELNETVSAYAKPNLYFLTIIRELPEAGVIVVAYLDRVSRSVYYSEDIWEKLQEKRIRLISINEQFDSLVTPNAKDIFMRAIAQGEHESTMISHRVINTLNYLISIGQRKPREKDRFGLAYVEGRYEEVAETPYIRRLAQLLSTAGSPIEEINQIISRYDPYLILSTYNKETKTAVRYLERPMQKTRIGSIITQLNVHISRKLGTWLITYPLPSENIPITFPYKKLQNMFVQGDVFTFSDTGELIRLGGAINLTPRVQQATQTEEISEMSPSSPVSPTMGEPASGSRKRGRQSEGGSKRVR